MKSKYTIMGMLSMDYRVNHDYGIRASHALQEIENRIMNKG